MGGNPIMIFAIAHILADARHISIDHNLLKPDVMGCRPPAR